MRAIRSARYLCLITLALPVVGCQREQASSAPAATAADAPSTATPSAPDAAPAERKYLLEKVEDAAIVQLYADGFAALPLRERALIYHLTQAAIAGRDIFYDQKHRDAMAMRSVLEAILTSSKGVDPTTLSGILTYTKLFWINNGPYNNLTAQKFVLPITPEAFVAAARQASSNGARFPTTAGESLDALLARLQPMFFNPDVDPVVTSKTPPPGEDILSASANNLYSGVRMRDLKGFTERYALNSRLVKTGSGLAEEVYRIDGRYG